MSLFEKDRADLCYNGLRSHLREKLVGSYFCSVFQVHVQATYAEKQVKNEKQSAKTFRYNVHNVEYDSDGSNDESSDVLAAEFVWPSKAKSFTCPSLRPFHKSR